MADRDINIPTGPAKANRLTIPEVEPGAGSPADATIAQPPISTADLRGFDVETKPTEEHPVDAWLSTPMDAVPEVKPMETDSVANDVVEADNVANVDAALDDASVGTEAVNETLDDVGVEVTESEFVGEGDAADADSDADADSGATRASASEPITDVAASLGALRDSIGQGRELKAREKDREDLAGKIDADRDELADRDDILANYQAIVAEQDRIIVVNTQQRDAYKAELSDVAAKTEETDEALGRMRDFHDVQLQPLETALGRAQATADQAKNDERSRKSELSAAETEVKRTENTDDATAARARLEVARAAFEDAVARSNAAKEALDEAQHAYDELKEQYDQAEAPLESALDDFDRRTEELKEEIARLGDIISTANKRRQYCDTVYQYPAETEKLRQSVESDELALVRLDEENDELRDRLAESKAKSLKAKVFIGAVIVIIILFICLFWYLSSR